MSIFIYVHIIYIIYNYNTHYIYIQLYNTFYTHNILTIIFISLQLFKKIYLTQLK